MILLLDLKSNTSLKVNSMAIYFHKYFEIHKDFIYYNLQLHKA